MSDESGLTERRESNKLIAERLDSLESGHVLLQTAVNKNSAVVEEIKKDTGDIIEFFDNAAGFIKTVTWLGSVAKILLIAGSSLAALWYAITHAGKFPS